MHVIEHTYISLLADVAYKSKFSEIRGSYYGLQWCLNEAPKLEKMLLASIESGVKLDLSSWPVALRRIAAGSVMDPVLLRLLRQLLLFCYKAYITHDTQTTENAFKAFLVTNKEVGEFGNSLGRASPRLLDSVRRNCQAALYRFQGGDIMPSHGPGAVTTCKDKWRHRYSTIDYLYPQSDWFSLYFNREHCSQLEESIDVDLIDCKVIAVPKDSRGPRLICVHPAEAIWIQQGLRRRLERAISLNRHAKGPWPHGHVHFDDQSVNGRIALNSSRSRRYATIDMKEASDRISEPLVQILFGSKYKWFGCCRAQKFTIPQIGSIANIKGQVNCYAPMGNATTFPVQSLVFWAICVSSLQRQGFHQPGAVFVFGDDIIIPSECAEVVVDDLESFGLVVNRTKSFWRGAFRESCGVEAFNGFDVTPVRWKTSVDAEHPAGLQSLSDIAMRLRMAGYEEAASTAYAALRTRLKRYGRDLFITNNSDHGGLAEFSTCDSAAWRDAFWHRDSQWFASRVWRFEVDPQVRTTSDWNHVLESVCSLELTGRSSIPARLPPRGARLNRGWIHVR
jgi:hypothetical protein